MKARLWLRHLGILLAGMALLSQVSSSPAKPVQLKDGVFISDPPPLSAKRSLASPSVNGLYLVQFTRPIQPEERKQLTVDGVTLVSYIPDDTFIARLQNVNLSVLEKLSFVRWVQPHQPGYKISADLRRQMVVTRQFTAAMVEVELLVVPGASGEELRGVRELFQTPPAESSRHFGLILRGTIRFAAVETLAASPLVLWLEAQGVPRLLDEASARIVAGDGGLHQTRVQMLGYDGSGVTVAVADSGFADGSLASVPADMAGRMTNFLFYGSLTNAADENGHGTHVAGIIAGDGATAEVDGENRLYGLGVAPDARIIVQRIFDGAGHFQSPPTYETLTREARRAGADIGSNSWGKNSHGDYDLTAAEFDELVRDAEDDNNSDPLTLGDQPYILEFSAGNAGPSPGTLDSPAVGKNIIATGASQSTRTDFLTYEDGAEVMADFSSRGPTKDGRIKPDLVAPGTWIASLHSPRAPDENALAVISSNYFYLQGTSQAGAHVSGAAAVFVQYYRQMHGGATPSPALVKAALINSARDMDNSFDTAPTPNTDEGWGRVNVAALVEPDRRFTFLDQTRLLTNGQIWQTNFIVASAAQPLKLTLAYTDVPGFPAAIRALVNDLDLELVAPDGKVFSGNRFDFNGASVPDDPEADRLNNVEGVFLPAPPPGEYTVRVRAYQVVQDARRDTTNAIDQDFALVVSGAIPATNESVVLFDRQAYTAPGIIGLKVIDPNATNSPSVAMAIFSSSETNAENVLLAATAVPGVYTGTIATATGPAVADGSLQIGDGDSITARYFESAAATNRYAAATADLIAPLLNNVAATNSFGRERITWQSDSPANSIIRYGTNPASLTLAATNPTLTTAHSLLLGNLLVGQTYYFKVISADTAGNLATNDQGGALYSFIAQAVAPVLLVDAYIPDFDSPFIPLATYTNALNQTGLGYETWSVLQNNAVPSLDVLSRYRAVIWRVNDSYLSASPFSTLGGAEQTLIRDYLAGGGSFFLASMEILSRLGNVPFRYDVLQVEAYTSNAIPYLYCQDCDQDSGVPDVQGEIGDPITAGMTFTLNYAGYPTNRFIPPDEQRRDLGDSFTLHDTGTQIFLNSGRVAGMRYQHGSLGVTNRVVFLTFPLDAIPEAVGTNNPAPNNRATFMRKVLNYLAPDIGQLGSIAFNAPTYRIPSLATIEVDDINLVGLSAVSVLVRSDTDTNGVVINLNVTSQPGVFRATVTLVAATNAPAPATLRVVHDDTLRADYFDASAATNVSATAIIDAQPPEINAVAAAPGFDEATVTWQTTELTDALVQFGETPLLGRTAFKAQSTLSHAVVLTGLLPDKNYYFRVVSRDAAGNATTDDNAGQFYLLHTLPPFQPPWADALESGVTNWSVQTVDGSQAVWTSGVPHNGLQTQAHSPANAWGSNLGGDPIATADTSLLSPAVLLTNGNQATLTFWHSYSFTNQPYNYARGRVYVLTNSLAVPILLALYTNASPAWQQEQLDLTPFLNRVVRIIWRYEYQASSSNPRPGWLVDDLAITITNVPSGTIFLTNNLWQARFTLSGPLSLDGQGRSTLITNAPPGQYTVTYGNAAYHFTPPAQTNTLAIGGNLQFTGNYTFADVNTNGLADAWEQNFFGAVASNHPAASDTDGDGASDQAEFIAGTDPTDALSVFSLRARAVSSDQTVRLDWPAATGHGYRVLGSTGLFGPWPALGPWTPAATNSGAYSLPATNPARFFRVEVQP